MGRRYIRTTCPGPYRIVTSHTRKLGGEDMAKEVKQEFVEADAAVIDEAISDDLFKPYVIANYGPQDGYPYCQTDVSQALDMLKETNIDLNLQKMGSLLTLRYAKEKYGRPLPNPDDPEDKILVPSPVASPNSFRIKKTIRQ